MPAHTSRMKTVNIGVRVRLTKNADASGERFVGIPRPG